MIDCIVTAVSERADLFVETMEVLLANIDVGLSRIVVHEDVRESSRPGGIGQWLEDAKRTRKILDFAHRVTSPSRGMGPALLWLLREAQTPIVLHTQEDWLPLRSLPIARALGLMESHDLHHISFNKRKTMRVKNADTSHPWYKVEVEFDGQKLCVCDHWRTQTSLWRVSRALPAAAACAEARPQANAFVAAFNDWMNREYGDGKRPWNDQQMRHERMRTYLWGPIHEPAFIKHLGSARTTGPIQHINGA